MLYYQNTSDKSRLIMFSTMGLVHYCSLSLFGAKLKKTVNIEKSKDFYKSEQQFYPKPFENVVLIRNQSVFCIKTDKNWNQISEKQFRLMAYQKYAVQGTIFQDTQLVLQLFKIQ